MSLHLHVEFALEKKDSYCTHGYCGRWTGFKNVQMCLYKVESILKCMTSQCSTKFSKK
ncbi:hypothetical protein Bca4012_026897 [Brassica carinata]